MIPLSPVKAVMLSLAIGLMLWFTSVGVIVTFGYMITQASR